MSDAADVEAARSGDRSAVARLAMHYQSTARVLARRVHANPADVEDAAAAGMVEFLLGIRRYDPTRDRPFSAYARATILGAVRKWGRDDRDSGVGFVSMDAPLPGSETLHDIIPDGAARAPDACADAPGLPAALLRLSAQQRVTAHMVGQGFSMSEIGDHLGISKQCAHKAYARALVSLRLGLGVAAPADG